MTRRQNHVEAAQVTTCLEARYGPACAASVSLSEDEG
jgi:hypothetical protein